MNFIPEIPAFLILGVRMGEGRCTVVACERLYNWHVTQTMQWDYEAETQIQAVLGPFVQIEGATFEECFAKMTHDYQRQGGHFTEQAGLPAPTPELEES